MEQTFQFDEDFQKKLLALLIRDLDFFSKYGHLIGEENFENEAFRVIYKLAKEYFEKYGVSIQKDALRNEVKEFFHKTKKEDVHIDDYSDVVNQLYAMDITQGMDYAADKITDFTKKQELKKSFLTAADSIRKNQPADVILKEQIKVLGELQEMGSGGKGKLNAMSVADFKQYKSFPFLIDPVLPEGVVVELVGREGKGKSMVAHSMIKAMITEVALWGRYPILKSGPVLLIDEENPVSLLAQRFKDMGFLLEHKSGKLIGHLHPLEIFHFQNIKIDDPTCFRKVLGKIKEMEAKFLVVDSLIRVHKRKDENSPTEMAVVMERFREIANTGVTVLIIHHQNKSGRYRGSTEIAAAADIVYSLHREDDSDDLILGCEKTRIKPFDPIKLKMEISEARINIKYDGSVADDTYGDICRILGNDWTGYPQIFIQFSSSHPNLKDGSLRRTLKRYVEKGRLEERPKPDRDTRGRPVIQYRIKASTNH